MPFIKIIKKGNTWKTKESQRKKKRAWAGQYLSMSVSPLAPYEWAIKHERNRKTTETQARLNPFCPILGPCPTLGTIASGNFS